MMTDHLSWGGVLVGILIIGILTTLAYLADEWAHRREERKAREMYPEDECSRRHLSPCSGPANYYVNGEWTCSRHAHETGVAA